MAKQATFLQKIVNNMGVGISNAFFDKQKKAIALQTQSVNRNIGFGMIGDVKKTGIPKPSKVTFEQLRLIANSDTIIRICVNVIKKAVSQAEWSIVPTKRFVDTYNPEHIERMNTLFERVNSQGENLRTLLDMVLEDLLVCDAGVVEKIFNAEGDLVELNSVDGSSIRPKLNKYGELGGYVQIINNKIVATFKPNEIIYIMQNPQNSIKLFGYGNCVPGDTWIQTLQGKKQISDIVRNKLSLDVLSFNESLNKLEYQKIINWYSRKYKDDMVRVVFGCGGKGKSIRCTKDHPILTKRGYVNAKYLKKTDKAMIKTAKLNKKQEEMVYGTLLGDSCLKVHYLKDGRKNIGYPAFQTVHSDKQKGYIDWISRNISNFGVSRTVQYNKSPNSNNIIKVHQVQTRTSPSFWEIYENCYVQGKKTISRKWLNKVGKLGLAMWIMDDGYIGKDSHVTMCTDCFSIEEHHILIKWLKEKFDLNGSILHAPSMKHPRLRITPYKKVLKIIRNYISLEGRELRKGNPKLWIASDLNVDYEETVCPVSIKSIDFYTDAHKTVFDISVNKNHNFLVNGAVVHNSPIEQILLTVQASLNADVYNAKVFSNDNIPPGFVDLGNMSEEEAQNLIAVWNATVIGNSQKLKFLWGSENAKKFTSFNSTNKDMQYMKYVDWLSRLKLAAYGLSAMDANITQDINRSTAEVSQSITSSRGVNNIFALLEDYINREIIMPMGFNDVQFRFKREINLKEKKQQAEIDKIYIETGVVLPSDVAKREGMDTFDGMDDDEGFDGGRSPNPEDNEIKPDEEDVLEAKSVKRKSTRYYKPLYQ